MAECLSSVRTNQQMKNRPTYDFITGEFRHDYPEIFAPSDWPEGLKQAFYENAISLEYLIKHPEYTSYLRDINLNSIMKVSFDFKKCFQYDD